MTGPFDRERARQGAQACRDEAETWRGALRDRRQAASAARRSRDAERILATTGHVAIAEARVRFLVEAAEAYERVAAGLPAYPAKP